MRTSNLNDSESYIIQSMSLMLTSLKQKLQQMSSLIILASIYVSV